ncbi:MAG TPA: VC0807 family protein [Actinomycetota bacterium]|jgi:intracellular septation protein A|nr:VC0807 family protein [Actinomycetota bacterium]
MSPTSPLPTPRLPALARHALPHLLEATLIPLGLFYGGLQLFGLWAALLAALVWSYTSLLRRVVLRRRVPGMLVLGIAGLTARTALALATGSAFLYFLQPTVGTGLVATLFLGSVLLGRPLALRLAADFLPLPEALLVRRGVRRFFQRVSLLWAAVFLANAGISLWLLVSQSLATFLWTRTVASLTLTGLAIVASTWWFRRCVRTTPAV